MPGDEVVTFLRDWACTDEMGDVRLAKNENTVAKVSFYVGQFSPHGRKVNFHVSSVKNPEPRHWKREDSRFEAPKGFFRPLLYQG